MELQQVAVTTIEKDILTIVQNEIVWRPYRMDNACRMIFVHLLAAIDMDDNENVVMNVKDHGILENTQNHRYSELMSALKDEQLGSFPSRTLKTAVRKAHEGVGSPKKVEFLGYAKTLHYALSLFMYNFAPSSHDMECCEAAEFVRFCMTDCKDSENHFITQPLFELDNLVNILTRLGALVC